MTDSKKLDAIIDLILKAEGGYVNNPHDRGGATNWGVTQREYNVYVGRETTLDDIKKMPIAHARDIFKKKYYFAPKINLLPEALQPVVTDASVLYGPKRAIIFLQKVLNQLDSSSGLGLDGDIGPATTVAANKQTVLLGADKIINAYVDERIRFCEAIVANRPSQRIFIKGWTNRANSFRPKKR